MWLEVGRGNADMDVASEVGVLHDLAGAGREYVEMTNLHVATVGRDSILFPIFKIY